MTSFPLNEPGGAPDQDRLRPRLAPEVDWSHWTRQLERKRRGRRTPSRWPGWLYRESTRATFQLEGIHVSQADVDQALNAPRPLRSRHAGRLRNHMAILRSLDRLRRQNRELTADEVIRWYTAVSSGLSTANLSAIGQTRLSAVIRQIHSPQRRLQPAAIEASKLYADLLADPMFPGFNGILARLLLHAYLLNSGLPPVIFTPARDISETTHPAVTVRLLEMMDQTFDRLPTTQGN